MTLAAAPLAAGLVAASDSARAYFATDSHYRAVAARILAVLGDRPGLLLVTGDPPPEAPALARVLSAVSGRWRVIPLTASPELSAADLAEAAGSLGEVASDAFVARLRPPPPLFVIGAAERLTETQIGEVLAPAAGEDAALVLLAPSGFLERRALPFLAERLDAGLRFEELGEDEVEAYIRHQLGAAGTFPPEIVAAIAKAANGDAALVNRLARLVLGFAATTGTMPPQAAVAGAAPAGEPASSPRRAAIHTGIAAAVALAVAALGVGMLVRNLPMPPPPATAPLASGELEALLARGDAFRASGDIASARLFYERAADAGSGPAALRLAESFDPALLAGAGVRGVRGDAAAAHAWYRRAAALGEPEAARRLETMTPR